jgi:hypothetical protein
MKTRTKPTWVPPDDRFLNTFGVCRPCHDQQALWERWHDRYGVPWEQDSLGMYEQIGKIGTRPVVVSVFWANIADRRVAFVEPTSELVDYTMVDDWCSAVFPNAVEFANESNFHNIVHPIADALGVRSVMAREFVFDLHAKYAPKNSDFMKPLVGGNTRTHASRIGVPFKAITRRELPKDPTNGGWKQKVMTMDWYDICMDMYPDWEIEPVGDQKTPAFVKLTHVRGDGDVESSKLASAWDDIASEQFYTRDWTDSGIPCVGKGEIYWSGWWFKTVAERDRFVAWQSGGAG